MKKEDIKVGGKYLFIFRNHEEDKGLDDVCRKRLKELSGRLVTVSEVCGLTCILKEKAPAVYFQELFPPLVEDNV